MKNKTGPNIFNSYELYIGDVCCEPAKHNTPSMNEVRIKSQTRW